MNEKNLIDFRKIKQAILDEPIPMHMKNWFYALGVTPFILFIFQVLTLIFILCPIQGYIFLPFYLIAVLLLSHLVQQ